MDTSESEVIEEEVNASGVRVTGSVRGSAVLQLDPEAACASVYSLQQVLQRRDVSAISGSLNRLWRGAVVQKENDKVELIQQWLQASPTVPELFKAYETVVSVVNEDTALLAVLRIVRLVLDVSTTPESIWQKVKHMIPRLTLRYLKPARHAAVAQALIEIMETASRKTQMGGQEAARTLFGSDYQNAVDALLKLGMRLRQRVVSLAAVVMGIKKMNYLDSPLLLRILASKRLALEEAPAQFATLLRNIRRHPDLSNHFRYSEALATLRSCCAQDENKPTNTDERSLASRKRLRTEAIHLLCTLLTRDEMPSRDLLRVVDPTETAQLNALKRAISTHKDVLVHWLESAARAALVSPRIWHDAATEEQQARSGRGCLAFAALLQSAAPDVLGILHNETRNTIPEEDEADSRFLLQEAVPIKAVSKTDDPLRSCLPHEDVLSKKEWSRAVAHKGGGNKYALEMLVRVLDRFAVDLPDISVQTKLATDARQALRQRIPDRHALVAAYQYAVSVQDLDLLGLALAALRRFVAVLPQDSGQQHWDVLKAWLSLHETASSEGENFYRQAEMQVLGLVRAYPDATPRLTACVDKKDKVAWRSRAALCSLLHQDTKISALACALYDDALTIQVDRPRERRAWLAAIADSVDTAHALAECLDKGNLDKYGLLRYSLKSDNPAARTAAKQVILELSHSGPFNSVKENVSELHQMVSEQTGDIPLQAFMQNLIEDVNRALAPNKKRKRSLNNSDDIFITPDSAIEPKLRDTPGYIVAYLCSRNLRDGTRHAGGKAGRDMLIQLVAHHRTTRRKTRLLDAIAAVAVGAMRCSDDAESRQAFLKTQEDLVAIALELEDVSQRFLLEGVDAAICYGILLSDDTYVVGVINLLLSSKKATLNESLPTRALAAASQILGRAESYQETAVLARFVEDRIVRTAIERSDIRGRTKIFEHRSLFCPSLIEAWSRDDSFSPAVVLTTTLLAVTVPEPIAALDACLDKGNDELASALLKCHAACRNHLLNIVRRRSISMPKLTSRMLNAWAIAEDTLAVDVIARLATADLGFVFLERFFDVDADAAAHILAAKLRKEKKDEHALLRLCERNYHDEILFALCENQNASKSVLSTIRRLFTLAAPSETVTKCSELILDAFLSSTNKIKIPELLAVLAEAMRFMNQPYAEEDALVNALSSFTATHYALVIRILDRCCAKNEQARKLALSKYAASMSSTDRVALRVLQRCGLPLGKLIEHWPVASSCRNTEWNILQSLESARLDASLASFPVRRGVLVDKSKDVIMQEAVPPFRSTPPSESEEAESEDDLEDDRLEDSYEAADGDSDDDDDDEKDDSRRQAVYDPRFVLLLIHQCVSTGESIIARTVYDSGALMYCVAACSSRQESTRLLAVSILTHFRHKADNLSRLPGFSTRQLVSRVVDALLAGLRETSKNVPPRLSCLVATCAARSLQAISTPEGPGYAIASAHALRRAAFRLGDAPLVKDALYMRDSVDSADSEWAMARLIEAARFDDDVRALRRSGAIETAAASLDDDRLLFAVSRSQLGRRFLVGKLGYHLALSHRLARVTNAPNRVHVGRGKEIDYQVAAVRADTLVRLIDASSRDTDCFGPERRPTFGAEVALVMDQVIDFASRCTDIKAFSSCIQSLNKYSSIQYSLCINAAMLLVSRAVHFYGPPLQSHHGGDNARLLIFIARMLLNTACDDSCRDDVLGILDWAVSVLARCISAQCLNPLHVAATAYLVIRFAFVRPQASMDSLIAMRLVYGRGFGAALNYRALDTVLYLALKNTQVDMDITIDCILQSTPNTFRLEAEHSQAIESIETHARIHLAPMLLQPPAGCVPPSDDDATKLCKFFLSIPRSPEIDFVQQRAAEARANSEKAKHHLLSSLTEARFWQPCFLSSS